MVLGTEFGLLSMRADRQSPICYSPIIATIRKNLIGDVVLPSLLKYIWKMLVILYHRISHLVVATIDLNGV